MTSFQRTALQDVELGGSDQDRQRVGLFYASANHDEDVFEDPFTFDFTTIPTRTPSAGVRRALCIGASLARTEIKLMFEALADLAPASTQPATRPAPPRLAQQDQAACCVWRLEGG